jgi:hypothetical protein
LQGANGRRIIEVINNAHSREKGGSMTIETRTESFVGRKVVDFSPMPERQSAAAAPPKSFLKSLMRRGNKSGEPTPPPAAARPVLSPEIVHRLALEYDSKTTMPDLLASYLGQIERTQLEALIIGQWNSPHDESPDAVLELLIKQAAELPNLKALFVGDMTFEECEISWIIQGHYQPLLAAFPQLQALRIRGSNSLSLSRNSHASLRLLAIECGGLPKSVLQDLAGSSFPALEHLELWLGTDDYGFDGSIADVTAAVEALRTPGLKYLGLCDSSIADEVAQWIAQQPWVAKLHRLDLSLGTLGDVGAQALCASPYVTPIPIVDLSHHYISATWQEKLRAHIAGVVLDDPQEEDKYGRFVAVGE